MDKSLSLSPSLAPGRGAKFASELKFVVSPEVAGEIREWARQNLESDPHGSGEYGDLYHISSIYLDTDGFDVLRKRGSYGRSKSRIRQYASDPAIYLERKMKVRGLVSKKRVKVTAADLSGLSSSETKNGEPTYWFHRRILARSLKPVCQIAYERTARVAMTEAGLIRLTLDEQVAAAPVDGFQFASTQPEPLPVGGVIVELKFRQQIPQLFAACIDQIGRAHV